MWFLWGFLMFFVCHIASNVFLSFVKKYNDKKEGMDLYVAIGAVVFWIGALIFGLTVIGSTAAVLVGNAIGFCTGYAHYKVNLRNKELEEKYRKNQQNNYGSTKFNFSPKQQEFDVEKFKEEFNTRLLSYGDNAINILKNKIELKRIVNGILRKYGLTTDDIGGFDDELDDMVKEMTAEMNATQNKGMKTISKMQKITSDPNAVECFEKGEIVRNIVNLMDARQKLTPIEYKYINEIFENYESNNVTIRLNHKTYLDTCNDIISHFDMVAPYYKFCGDLSMDDELSARSDEAKKSFRVKAKKLLDDDMLFSQEWYALNTQFQKKFYNEKLGSFVKGFHTEDFGSFFDDEEDNDEYDTFDEEDNDTWNAEKEFDIPETVNARTHFIKFKEMFFNGFKSGMKGGFFDQRVQAVNNGKQEPLSITIYNALHTSVGEELKIRNVKSDLVSIKFDTYDDFKLLIMELNGDEVLESKYIIMALYKDGETSKYYTVIRTDGYADNGMTLDFEWWGL